MHIKAWSYTVCRGDKNGFTNARRITCTCQCQREHKEITSNTFYFWSLQYLLTLIGYMSQRCVYSKLWTLLLSRWFVCVVYVKIPHTYTYIPVVLWAELKYIIKVTHCLPNAMHTQYVETVHLLLWKTFLLTMLRSESKLELEWIKC